MLNTLSSTVNGWPANGGDVLVFGLDILVVWLVRVGYLMRDQHLFLLNIPVNVPVNPIIEFILKTIFRFILKSSTHLNGVHIEEMIPK